MRLWSIHPAYLDQKGLGALWREGLLALAVCAKQGAGYHKHSQLERFKQRFTSSSKLKCALAFYLETVRIEAVSRGYQFDASLIEQKCKGFKKALQKEEFASSIPVTDGQVCYETKFLHEKLKIRSCPHFSRNLKPENAKLHPIFYLKKGPVEKWERPK